MESTQQKISEHHGVLRELIALDKTLHVTGVQSVKHIKIPKPVLHITMT